MKTVDFGVDFKNILDTMFLLAVNEDFYCCFPLRDICKKECPYDEFRPQSRVFLFVRYVCFMQCCMFDVIKQSRVFVFVRIL